MPQVQVIQPIQQQPKRLRVAAYARVSSDSEDQLRKRSRHRTASRLNGCTRTAYAV